MRFWRSPLATTDDIETDVGLAARPARAVGRSPELASIQALRAIAALAVAIAHTYPLVGIEFGIAGYPTLITGAAGVDLFFVISGFIMVYASEDLFEQPGAPRTFFLRRLIRIVPLYWLVTTVLLVYLLLRYRSLLEHTPVTVVASYFFIPTYNSAGPMAPVLPVGWTLNYEMFFYLVFAGGLLLKRTVAVIVLSALLTAFGLWGRQLALPVPLSILADPIILEFVFGMLVALAYREGLKLPQAAALGLIAVGFGALAASAAWDLASISRVIIWGIPSACLVAGCVFFGDPTRPKSSVARADLSWCVFLFALPDPCSHDEHPKASWRVIRACAACALCGNDRMPCGCGFDRDLHFRRAAGHEVPAQSCPALKNLGQAEPEGEQEGNDRWPSGQDKCIRNPA